MPRPQHPLVERLIGSLPGPAAVPPPATALPELVPLVGYVDGTITKPGSNTDWVLVYLDWRMTSWMLVEATGILHYDSVPEDGDRSYARDVLMVLRDTAVGRGSGPQSNEARFLTGHFTRAGDFNQWETGGPSSAETGLFCPNTPLCNCGKRSR